jgi:sugar O-acyltransferase (sialic acid O-acetyltransferase NeuD family)
VHHILTVKNKIFMKKIILIGGGGHCKSVIDVIEQEAKFEIIGIIDKPKLLGSKVLGYSVVGSDLDLNRLAKKYKYALITVGQIKTALIRIKLFNLAIKSGFTLASIISPKAYISKHSRIGMGTIIMHHAIVNANSFIGDNCIINTKALVEHDCSISDHCHISTNATINGGNQIGSKSFIGSNVTTKEYIKIESNSFIKAGSLIK